MANTLKFGNGEWYGKEDTILAYNDENSNFKPLPFDFERGSTATRINADGLIETVGSGEPRVDYKDDSKGALLLEPSRTNYITYSEDFSQNSWTKTNSTISSNQDISPDGTNNASLFSAVGQGRLRINFSPPSTKRTFSIWVKSYNNTQSNGILTFSGLNSISFTTTNEWQRITTTRDVVGDTFKCSLRTTDSSLLVWGAQLEEGSYPTSYIPTQGTAQTRLADSCSQTVPDGVIGQTEGVLYAEIAGLADGGDTRAISIFSAGDNRITLVLHSTTNRVQFFIAMNGYINTVDLDATDIVQTDTNKIACKFKANDYALWINGIEKDTNTTQSNTIQSGTLNSLKFDINGSNPFYGNVKDVRVYNTALTDQELIALTTI